jgi:hypothetical protein
LRHLKCGKLSPRGVAFTRTGPMNPVGRFGHN